MPVRVAINGFGRVGRAALRAAHENGADIEFVAINDLAEGAQLAHLLRRDSVYGRFPGDVELVDDVLMVDGHELPVLHLGEPALGRA